MTQASYLPTTADQVSGVQGFRVEGLRVQGKWMMGSGLCVFATCTMRFPVHQYTYLPTTADQVSGIQGVRGEGFRSDVRGRGFQG
jgi:hypothetical protein